MQITVINGSVEYDGVPILTDVDFELHDKEKVALVGRNGCGKTTLLKQVREYCNKNGYKYFEYSDMRNGRSLSYSIGLLFIFYILLYLL